MLDDRERAMLLDIENHLLADDPGWCTAFAASARPLRRQYSFELVFHVLAMLTSASLTLLMVVTDALPAALLFATVTGLLVWLLRHLRHPVARDVGSGRPDAPPTARGRP